MGLLAAWIRFCPDHIANRKDHHDKSKWTPTLDQRRQAREELVELACIYEEAAYLLLEERPRRDGEGDEPVDGF